MEDFAWCYIRSECLQSWAYCPGGLHPSEAVAIVRQKGGGPYKLRMYIACGVDYVHIGEFQTLEEAQRTAEALAPMYVKKVVS